MPPAKKPAATTRKATATGDAGGAGDVIATGPQGGEANDQQLADTLDALNLEQAMLDFAGANARVLDLTRRLSTLTAETVALRDENVRQAIELERLRPMAARLEALERSKAVKVATSAQAALRKGLSRVPGGK